MSPMKAKVVAEYQKMIHSLQLGYSYKYDYILDMINFIEVGSHTSNPPLIQEYFLNL